MRRVLLWLPVLLGCGIVFLLYRSAVRPVPAASPAPSSQAEQQRQWQQEVARLQAQEAERKRLQHKAQEAAFSKTLAEANRHREQFERTALADASFISLPRAPADVQAYLSKIVDPSGTILVAAAVIAVSCFQAEKDPSLPNDPNWWHKMRVASTEMKSAAGDLRRIHPVPGEFRHVNQRMVEVGTKIQGDAGEFIRGIDARNPKKMMSAVARMERDSKIFDQVAEELQSILACYR